MQNIFGWIKKNVADKYKPFCFGAVFKLQWRVNFGQKCWLRSDENESCCWLNQPQNFYNFYNHGTVYGVNWAVYRIKICSVDFFS